MTGAMPRQGHGFDLTGTSSAIVPYVVTLDGLAHAPQPLPHRDDVLHLPLFFHQSSTGTTPVFPESTAQPRCVPRSSPFKLPATYQLHMRHPRRDHERPSDRGTWMSSSPQVTIADFSFSSANVTVGVGGTVTWTNNGPSQHCGLELGGGNLPSYCFSGRSFVGNTPDDRRARQATHPVLRLDLYPGMTRHNFHPDAQRWRFANDTIDVRSLGPAESWSWRPPARTCSCLVPSSSAPRTLTSGQKTQRNITYAADFLVHYHVEMHMMQGLVALVRTRQAVWLTNTQAHELSTEIGLAIDRGGNACSAAQLDHCATAIGGRWDELLGLSMVSADVLNQASRR